jgi:hypothetical protein
MTAAPIPLDTTAEKFTAAEMRRRLAARYPTPQWAYFDEVRDASGFRASRSADGVAFDTYQGHAIHGFEIKVDRADWLRELKQPGKCEAVAQHCDFWWIVAAPNVVRAGELPPQWGLLLPNGDGLRVEKRAPQREGVSDRLPRSLVALLFRRAVEASPSVEALTAARRAGVEEGKRRAEADALRDPSGRELGRLRERVAAFERAAGVSIDEWDLGSIAEAVKIAKADRVAHRRDTLRREMQRLAEQAESIAKHLRDDHAALTSPAS